MNANRILLLSNTRPFRAWKFARRIAHEVPGATICGIVQRPMQKLPLAQQLIVHGFTNSVNFSDDARVRIKLGFYSLFYGIMHWVLWLVHGCPRNLNNVKKITGKELAEKCDHLGWPFLQAESMNDATVLDFIRRQKADLLIVLGDVALNPELFTVSTSGIIRAYCGQCYHDETKASKNHEIRMEHFAQNSETPFSIATIKIPLQSYEGLSGCTLKTDLIADDLLIQTAIALQTESPAQVSKAVMAWIQKIYSPYIAQLEPAAAKSVQEDLSSRRFRSFWKLCIETLLFYPYVTIRNWYRRWRGQYPVLILGHHLVSDRPHRMGISTEKFWRAVRFIQRHYQIVSLSRAIGLLRLGAVQAPVVAFTFDDGYADNFVSLRAVAEETNIPVTLFISTQPVELQHEFQHDLAHKSKGALPLTWDQIRYWSRCGADFGSHTRTHLDCGSASRAKLEWEMIGSRQDLEGNLGKPVSFFAFPFGKPGNISSDAADVASSVYSYFASSFGGENLPDPASDRGQHLLRKNLYSDPWELELELQSVFDWIEAIKLRFSFKPAESAISTEKASATSFNI